MTCFEEEHTTQTQTRTRTKKRGDYRPKRTRRLCQSRIESKKSANTEGRGWLPEECAAWLFMCEERRDKEADRTSTAEPLHALSRTDLAVAYSSCIRLVLAPPSLRATFWFGIEGGRVVKVLLERNVLTSKANIGGWGPGARPLFNFNFTTNIF